MQTISSDQVKENLLSLKVRILLLAIYLIGLIISFAFLFSSVFVLAGSGPEFAKIGVFLSALAFPVCIIIAMITMFYTKKYSKKLLLPFIPLLSLFCFNYFITSEISNSNEEFCKENQDICDSLINKGYYEAEVIEPTI